MIAQENHIIKKTDELPVMESFYTIQGEGFHQGKAAYFIRLAGCDVGCSWCDVKESWDEKFHTKKQIHEIISGAKNYPRGIAVITGGEPCMYNLRTLTEELQLQQFNTHLETSGAYPISGNFDWICVSPKKFKPPIGQNLQLANELKVIIYNQHDFLWATEFEKKVSKNCKLFLQPEWSKEKKMLPKIIDYIKENPQWALSIQLHKYIQVP